MQLTYTFVNGNIYGPHLNGSAALMYNYFIVVYGPITEAAASYIIRVWLEVWRILGKGICVLAVTSMFRRLPCNVNTGTTRKAEERFYLSDY